MCLHMDGRINGKTCFSCQERIVKGWKQVHRDCRECAVCGEELVISKKDKLSHYFCPDCLKSGRRKSKSKDPKSVFFDLIRKAGGNYGRIEH